MKNYLFSILSLTAFSVLFFSCIMKNDQFPEAKGFVNDYENVLSFYEEKKLVKQLKEHEKKTTNQIVIVSTSTILNYKNMRQYSLALANHWGIGTKELDNGILIMFSKSKREIQIQNGLGIVDKLTDQETKNIIDSLIIPAFKKEQYFVGLSKGINEIINEIE